MKMSLIEALAASDSRSAFAVCEDIMTLVTVDMPQPGAYRYRFVKAGQQLGQAVTTWPLEAIETLSHNGCWYPLRERSAEDCIF